MLWFYNLNPNDNNTINFYQVFIENNLVYSDKDSNLVYSFDSTDSTDSANSTELLKINLDLNNYAKDNINCEIKIIDHLIYYGSKNTNLVFMTKSNFIKPEENKLNLPVFSHTYKPTSIRRLPNLIESEYDAILTIDFQIYKLDKENKIQFIIEKNPITNSVRKYFITTNLDLINNFFKK